MDYKKLIETLERGIEPGIIPDLKLGNALPLNRMEQIRKEYPELPLSDLLNHFELQKRGRARFEDAEKMVFTAKGLEQSSSEVMGKYHVRRAGKAAVIADLCCGIGGDLMYLAENRKQVYAVDLDADTLLCARYNCRKWTNIKYYQQAAETFQQKVHLIYADPDRRPQGNRKISPEEMQPTLRQLVELYFHKELCGGMLIKLAPVLNYRKVEKEYFGNRGHYAEARCSWEFISENGTVKEILLCLGDQASAVKRQAVLLPSGQILSGSGSEEVAVSGWQPFIFEPDNAIIRAGLVQKLGVELGYQLLDQHLALLTGNEAVSETFGKLYRLSEVLPFNRKLLQKYLREKGIGELVIKTRGFPDTTEKLHKQFQLRGSGKMIMLIVRLTERHQVAILDQI